MRTTILITALLMCLAATVAAQPPGPPPRGPEFLLPPDWWQGGTFNVKLTKEQTQKLDQLQNAQRDELTRLERELSAAAREIRAALDNRDANADRIVTAGNRFAALRDQLLRKQIALLAAQRAVLTQAQWSALQQQLESHRPPPPPR